MRSELPLLGTSHQQEPRNFKYRYLGFLIDVDTERTECFHTFLPQEVTAMYFHFSSWKIYHKHISANLNSAHVLFINFKLFNFLKFPFIILELKFVTGIASLFTLRLFLILLSNFDTTQQFLARGLHRFQCWTRYYICR